MKKEFHWMGLVSFSKALDQQTKTLEKVRQDHRLCFLGMEHPLVLTLGLRSHKDPSIESYKRLFPKVFPVRRGGHLVVHNPGQLVIYPIVNIRGLGLSVRTYVALLIRATEAFLISLGVETFEKQEPGLFTKRGKIAMFGVGLEKGITCHGLCVNITNNLEDFKKIPVCGVRDQVMDQVAFHTDPPSMKRLFQFWVDCFILNLGHAGIQEDIHKFDRI